MGKRREQDGDDAPLGTITSAITRGYTGHEMIDEVGLINMNGRIQDPTIGAFLSADPIIQDVYNGKSLNRFSYVWNNPLSYTDPSGFMNTIAHNASGNSGQNHAGHSSIDQVPDEIIVQTYRDSVPDALNAADLFFFQALIDGIEIPKLDIPNFRVLLTFDDGSELLLEGEISDVLKNAKGLQELGQAAQSAGIKGALEVAPGIDSSSFLITSIKFAGGEITKAAEYLSFGDDSVAKTVVRFNGDVEIVYNSRYYTQDPISRESTDVHEQVHVDQITPLIVKGCPWGCFTWLSLDRNKIEIEAYEAQGKFLRNALINDPRVLESAILRELVEGTLYRVENNLRFFQDRAGNN